MVQYQPNIESFTMQGYIYSVFSIGAIAIHLIINFNLLRDRKLAIARGACYRGFLMGVLAYYVTDAAWGILAGLDWTRALYLDTVLYFIALVVFVFMWSRFVIDYIGLGKWMARIISCYGWALLLFNIVMLTANVFNGCFFYFDEQGVYIIGEERYLAFSFLIAFNVLVAIAVLVKIVLGKEPVRGRNMMVFVNSVTMTVAIALQVVWPLTPFTALGCLIGNCFLHIFVIEDEQTERHTSELEKALERARVAEKSRSTFFSIVSHDIRTPLNAIIGYSELLQYGITNKADRDEALNSIRASGTTLLQLVNDVLDLAKMDAGKMVLKRDPVLIEQLADEVLSSFKMNAAEKGIELVNRTAGVPMLMLDGHRFRQILFNLIGNAVKFTERGAVKVSASYAGANLEVSVTDTGCGIAPDMITHILDPFVQVQDPSHSAYRSMGTGLGLSICKRLVEAMGGQLLVESAIGKGSSFTVRIPGVEKSDAKVELAGPKSIVTMDSLPKHVLVVDDSQVNRLVLTAFLRKAGITAVDHACDGVDALAKIDAATESSVPYDLILSDFWMPNMSGMELVKKLRDDPRFRRLPVFAVTADTEYHNDPRVELFTGIILKPMTYGKLIEALTDQKIWYNTNL